MRGSAIIKCLRLLDLWLTVTSGRFICGVEPLLLVNQPRDEIICHLMSPTCHSLSPAHDVGICDAKCALRAVQLQNRQNILTSIQRVAHTTESNSNSYKRKKERENPLQRWLPTLTQATAAKDFTRCQLNSCKGRFELSRDGYRMLIKSYHAKCEQKLSLSGGRPVWYAAGVQRHAYT